MSVFGPSYRRHIFDPLSKIPCEVATNAKSIGMIFAIFLLIIPILACTAGGSSGSGTGSSSGVRGGSSAPLTLLPDNTSRLEVLDVSTISGGGVPEGFETQFESQWEPYSLGDDIVTIDDVNSLVRAVTPDGEILMLSGSQIDFAGVRDWLTSEDANIEETSYQGQELWGGDGTSHGPPPGRRLSGHRRYRGAQGAPESQGARHRIAESSLRQLAEAGLR